MRKMILLFIVYRRDVDFRVVISRTLTSNRNIYVDFLQIKKKNRCILCRKLFEFMKSFIIPFDINFILKINVYASSIIIFQETKYIEFVSVL